MPADVLVTGMSAASLDAYLGHVGEGSIPAEVRRAALARYENLPVRENMRSGRSWKRDLAKLDLAGVPPFDPAQSVELDVETLAPNARRAGVTIERFSKARELHRDAFEAAFGSAVDTTNDKFASLALAFQNHGVFVHVPAGVSLDEPLVLGYEARASALIPYTLISVGEGSRITIVEHFSAAAGAPFVCGIAELVVAARAHLTYAVDQRTAATTRVVMVRRATIGADATLEASFAELGSDYSVLRFHADEDAPGARAETSVVFFSDGDQHIDVETETVHVAGDTDSHTVVRTAGIGRGQGRFFGNIKILKSAHGSNAVLRDDALLLSKTAHIDSVPALEIAANDVKAFHGATVGAISDEELFYAESRGIARADAEKMIALGFFEPALERFPGEALREEIRGALAAKLVASAPTA